jgi:hypothetical protein
VGPPVCVWQKCYRRMQAGGMRQFGQALRRCSASRQSPCPVFRLAAAAAVVPKVRAAGADLKVLLSAGTGRAAG